VTADELFLLTLLDLEERAHLGRGEYDALNMAWLLRKLLLDEFPLVHVVNRSRRIPLRFIVNDESPPPGIIGWGLTDAFYPDPAWENIPTVELTFDEFLRRTVLVESRQTISVRDLVRFLANNYGAVHTTPAHDPKSEALRDAAWGSRISTGRGNFSGPVYSLIAVARVVLSGLDDLRVEVDRQTWHGLLPPEARGLARHDDPANRDVRPTQA